VQLDGRAIAEVLNGVPTYLHPDLLGSPRLGTNASGSTVWREHYGPYGEKLNGVNDKIGYTGHAYDAESQLTYAQARFYDPAVGRFMSIDPIGFTGNPASFTRYAYANNNPFVYTDPTGMCAVSLSGCDGSSNDLGGIEGTEASGSRIPSASTAMMAMMMGGVAGGNAGVQGNAIAANSSNSSSSSSSGGTNLDIEGVQVASSGAPPPPEAPQLSTTAVIDSAIKRGDVKQLETLRDIASPQESAAITRALTPARNLIQGRLKRSPSYRSELEEKTYTEIVKLSRGKGEEANAAKQMKKLIEQGSRLDEKVR
jgi:RHS repeat-associated protein